MIQGGELYFGMNQSEIIRGEKYEIWKLLSWQLSKCMINYMIDKK